MSRWAFPSACAAAAGGGETRRGSRPSSAPSRRRRRCSRTRRDRASPRPRAPSPRRRRATRAAAARCRSRSGSVTPRSSWCDPRGLATGCRRRPRSLQGLRRSAGRRETGHAPLPRVWPSPPAGSTSKSATGNTGALTMSSFSCSCDFALVIEHPLPPRRTCRPRRRCPRRAAPAPTRAVRAGSSPVRRVAAERLDAAPSRGTSCCAPFTRFRGSAPGASRRSGELAQASPGTRLAVRALSAPEPLARFSNHPRAANRRPGAAVTGVQRVAAPPRAPQFELVSGAALRMTFVDRVRSASALQGRREGR